MRLSADTDASRRRSRSRGRDRGRTRRTGRTGTAVDSNDAEEHCAHWTVADGCCLRRHLSRLEDLVDTALDRSICSAYILESAKGWMGVPRAIVTCCESIMTCEVCL